MTIRRGLLSPALAALVLALSRVPAGAAIPPATDVVSVEAESSMLLAVEIAGIPMDAVLSAFTSQGVTFLPLGEICRALDLAIEVDPGRSVAEGFFLSEGDRFRLDAATREIRRGKHTFPWDSTGIRVRPDDIYVATGLFATWFGLDLTVRRQASAVTVTSADPLPIQARAERARRIQQTLVRGETDRSIYRPLHDPHRPWSRPFVDQHFQSTTTQRDGRRVSEWQSATHLTADLLYMETDLYVQGRRTDPLAEVRGSTGRRDPRPALLGPLRAREYRAGEVGSQGLALISRSVSGPGFVVSNFPLHRPSQYGEHSFRGHLAAGWDAELHRDDALIAYQGSRPDGTYLFDAIPLRFGLNEFRLVFNGPHGERRESREVFNIGPSLTPPGELYYRLVSNGFGDPAPRTQLETDFHVAGNVSASFAVASVRMDGQPHRYVGTGVRAFWSHLFAGADLAVDDAGGEALELGLQARSRRFGAGVRHAALSNGFRSEVFRSSLGAIERRTTGQFDASLSPFRRVRIPFNVDLASERLRSGHVQHSWSNRVGLGLGRASLSHQMRRSVARGPGQASGHDLRSSLLASLHARRWSLRGSLDYTPGTNGGWRAIHLVTEAPAFKGIRAAMGVGHDPTTLNTRVFADLGTNQGALGWSVRTEAGSRSGVSLSLGLSVGLNQEPRRGGWHAHARPIANTGAASAQVFLDANGNGARDADETPLTGVGLVVNRAQSPQKTDENGVLFLTGLPGGEVVSLQLAAGSLEDPLWVPQAAGMRLVPRPGHTALLDFPVVISGEVVGTVSVSGPQGPQVVSGVKLELVDAATGEVVRRIVTAYDGFFDMTAILPGRYRLRVAASQLRRFGLSVAPSRPIDIAATGTVYEGVDFLLEPDPVPARER